MGIKGSKLVKTIVSPFNAASSTGPFDSPHPKNESNNNRSLASPLILKRQGSMYFDEDGDLAHEFYEEILPKNRGSKAKMKKIQSNLIPQGDVHYECPRLHNDYPVILYQV